MPVEQRVKVLLLLLCALKGKKKCTAMSKQILKVLIDLLGQDSDEVSAISQCIFVFFWHLFKYALVCELM